MNIYLLSVGNRMPRWVVEGYQEYAKRLPPECAMRLIEIPPGHRGKSADMARTLQDEGKRLLKMAPKGSRLVALEVTGKAWSTEQLSRQLGKWMEQGQDLALMVGGPDGLAPECLQQAELSWSLSPLTLPHGLVRVVVAEQIYRAWSMLRNHPYHRAG